MSCSDCPDQDLRSHGADALTGPPCCHGHTPECGGYSTDSKCGDHTCCPDPCDHSVWNRVACPAPCCHHVPKSFCARFIPDSATEFCFETGYKSSVALHTDIGTEWTFLLPGVGQLFIAAEQDAGPCVWRIRAPDNPYLDESVPIDHWGEANCKEPPVFTIEGVSYPVVCDTCTGRYEITPYDGGLKIPFQSRFDCTTPQTAEVACGSCSEVPTILCVMRLNPGTPSDLRDPYVRTEFIWDDLATDHHQWVNGSDHIDLIEYEGNCHLEPHIAGLEWLEDEVIAVDPDHCATGMNLRVERYGTDEYVDILGAPCSMFKFLCGNCRCICRDVCMVGMQDGEMVEGVDLAWNGSGWSGQGDYAGSIILEADENGNCQVRYGEWEPVAISNACGDRLTFALVDPYNTNNWRYVYCKECAPCNAGGGDCRSVCPDIPTVLYADLDFVEWTPAFCGPAEGPAPTDPPCIESVSIPMFLVRAAPEASFSHFWLGRMTVSCRSCDGGVSDPFETEITIMLTCNGELSIGGNTWVVTIPCGCEGGEWNIEVLTDGLAETLGGACCQHATASITITR